MAFTPNGLELINLGVAPNTGTGDSLLTITEKLNRNMARVLAVGDNLAGTGLDWDPAARKLSLKGFLPGQLLVGGGVVNLNPNEFEVGTGTLRLKQVDLSKVTGLLPVSRIALPNRSIAIGSPASTANSTLLDEQEFTLTSGRLQLGAIPASKLTGLAVGAGQIALAQNQMLLGGSDGLARTVQLGPDFEVVGGSLGVVGSTQLVGLNSIGAGGTQQPGRVLGLSGTTGALGLAWLAPNDAVEEYVQSSLSLAGSKYELYVNGAVGDDSITNGGTSPLTPFRTIERALLEVARTSYVPGQGTESAEVGTDEFERVVINVAAGIYEIDNRPGLNSLVSLPVFNGEEETLPSQLFNPVTGGLVIPRGCSIVGSSLRNVKLYPRWVPDPTLSGASAAILKVTGGSYIAGVTFTDNPTVLESHHRVNAIEFASVGEVNLYYEKIHQAFDALQEYGEIGGVQLEPTRMETELVGSTAVGEAPDALGRSRTDTVSGSSPYVFNCSVRSRYGLCGIYADGARVTGFKSMVTAQFTQVSLQIDPRAYVEDLDDPVDEREYSWRHYGFRAVNGAYMQIVSSFVICNAVHYAVESGAELSITNSCSNFGGIALLADGYQTEPTQQTRDFAIARIIPPLPISYQVRDIRVGLLNTEEVTSGLIAASQTFTVGRIAYPATTQVHVRIGNPVTPGQAVDLSATVVNPELAEGWVVSTVGNTIYQYLTVQPESTVEYLDSWYNSTIDPDRPENLAIRDILISGGVARTLEEQRTTEAVRRADVLNGASVFVKRILDSRAEADRHFRVLVRFPSPRVVPVDSYVIDRPGVEPRRYLITGLLRLRDEELNLPGHWHLGTLLRADAGANGEADLLSGVVTTRQYIDATANIDPVNYPTPLSLEALAQHQSSLSYVAIEAFLSDLDYTEEEIAQMLQVLGGQNLIDRCRNLVPKVDVYENGLLMFDLLRPSTIRASNHTWEWVGYKNYSTALPRYQQTTLSSLKYIQTSLRGGRVYATGMNQDGLFFIGERTIDLRTQAESIVSFADSPNAVGGVLGGGGNATNEYLELTVQQLKLGTIDFSPSSGLTVQGGVLNEASTPLGIKSNTSQYGLVRRATPTEVENYSNLTVYPTPADAAEIARQVINALPGWERLGGSGADGLFQLPAGVVPNTSPGATLSSFELEGTRYYTGFTLPAGVVMSVKPGLRTYARANMDIAGAILAEPIFQPGSVDFQSEPGKHSGENGFGLGGGRSAGGAGIAYNWELQPYGSRGGDSQLFVVNGTSYRSFGGAAGGSVHLEAAGTITIRSGSSITATGRNAVTDGILTGNVASSGPGGGSGGLIYIRAGVAIIVESLATLLADGGNGGDGLVSGTAGSSVIAWGGGAGAGGRIYLEAPSIIISPSAVLRARGGESGVRSPGAISTQVMLYGGGGAGFGGQGGDGYGEFDPIRVRAGNGTIVQRQIVVPPAF